MPITGKLFARDAERIVEKVLKTKPRNIKVLEPGKDGLLHTFDISEDGTPAELGKSIKNFLNGVPALSSVELA